jgi:hypothetical protein
MYLDFLEQEFIPFIEKEWFAGRVLKGAYGIRGQQSGRTHQLLRNLYSPRLLSHRGPYELQLLVEQ